MGWIVPKLRSLAGQLLDLVDLREQGIAFYLRHVLPVSNKLRFRQVELAIVLWPPAKAFFEEIEAEVNERYQITESADYLIRDESFEKMVQDIYSIDHASRRKIDGKLAGLRRPPLVIRLLRVRVPNPTLKPLTVDNRVRCIEIEQLKVTIRRAYQDRIPDYVYDVIIHSAESEEQSHDVVATLSRHSVRAATLPA